MTGRIYLSSRNVPPRLTLTIRWKSSHLVSISGLTRTTPATLASTSTRPNSRMTSSITRLTAPSSVFLCKPRGRRRADPRAAPVTTATLLWYVLTPGFPSHRRRSTDQPSGSPVLSIVHPVDRPVAARRENRCPRAPGDDQLGRRPQGHIRDSPEHLEIDPERGVRATVVLVEPTG